MLATLLVGAAFARPPQVGLALGPVVGGGTSTLGSYVSAAPATAVTVTWHLGPLESWVGASGSLLMAGQGDEVVPASLLQGELGLGLGAAGFGAGVYGGNGFPGPLVGLYGRATLPSRGWMRRVGVESRLFYTQATASTGLAVMLRVEPDWIGKRRARPEAEETVGAAHGGVEVSGATPHAEPVEATPQAEPVEATVEATPQAEPVEATPQAEPVEASPQAEPVEATPAQPTHHDEPY